MVLRILNPKFRIWTNSLTNQNLLTKKHPNKYKKETRSDALKFF